MSVPDFSMAPLKGHIRRMGSAVKVALLAPAVGSIGGAGFYWLNLPLPWLTGALIFTACLAFLGLKLPHPTAFRRWMNAVIGVLLGAGFTPALLAQSNVILISVGLMLICSVAMAVFGYGYGRYVAGYGPKTALFAGMPGGLSIMIASSMDSGADQRIVALAHTMRLTIILLVTGPVILAVSGTDLSSIDLMASGAAVSDAGSGAPSAFWGLSTGDAAWLLLSGVAGWWLAQLLRIPAPYLIGPLLFSAVIHVVGITDAQPPGALIILAQLVLGSSVGILFAGLAWSTLRRVLAHAAAQSAILVLLTLLLTIGCRLVLGLPLPDLILAYVPGGAPEMGLAALALGIAPAFVSTHHLVRVVAILFVVPVILKLLPASADGAEETYR